MLFRFLAKMITDVKTQRPRRLSTTLAATLL